MLRVIVAGCAIVVLAAVGAWFLAWNNCLNLLSEHREFVYFCGHNTMLQLVPLFFLLVVVLTLLLGISVSLWKARRSSRR